MEIFSKLLKTTMSSNTVYATGKYSFCVLLHTTLQHMGKQSATEFQKALNGGVYQRQCFVLILYPSYRGIFLSLDRFRLCHKNLLNWTERKNYDRIFASVDSSIEFSSFRAYYPSFHYSEVRNHYNYDTVF